MRIRVSMPSLKPLAHWGNRILLLVLAALGLLGAARANAAPTVAFFYADHPPLAALSTYDWAVVEPDHLPSPPNTGKTQWFAYVSLGEVHPQRDYFKDIPAEWKLGENKDWGGAVIDQRQPGWPAFVVDRMITPLWQRGYHAFFMDTLDAFNLVARTDAERQAQADGLVRVIAAIKARYPDAKLLANRGFEIMPRVHEQLAGVAFESLIQGWDAGRKQYRSVPAADQQWLLSQLEPVTRDYHLPVIAIDYALPADAPGISKQIIAHGFIPWVADPLLATLGSSRLKPVPRKVYILYNSKHADPDVMHSDLMYLATPLNYLGLATSYINVDEPLPELDPNQIAGVVSWLHNDEMSTPARTWVERAMSLGIPWAMLDDPGFSPDAGWFNRMGLSIGDWQSRVNGPRLNLQDPIFDHTGLLTAQGSGFYSWHQEKGQTLLQIGSANGQKHDAAAIMPWGGYVLSPYLILGMPDRTDRWLFDPVQFFQRALRLPAAPVPDVSTENGRRLFMFHVDGDGFVSKVERPGYPFAGQILLDEVIKRYPMPSTISVIEGEVGPTGLYPKDSPALEKIARQIFTQPNVEIASHSYSHPFRWGAIEAGAPGQGSEYHLKIPGYVFSSQREVSGSIDYINQHLAPPGKRVAVYLWPGDCDPPADAVEMVKKAGVVAMNGGDTTITRSQNSLTLMAPLGINKGQGLQIFAPNQDENVYTNDWTGPFYGFRRAIETYQLTDEPRRYKPIDVYIHYYTVTKRASLDALHTVLQWALAQDITPVYASQYIVRAQSFFNDVQIAQDGAAFVVHAGAVRTLRIPQSLGYPDLATSSGVAGYRDHGSDRYLHLIGPDARITFTPAVPTGVSLADANGLIIQGSASAGQLQLSLQAEQRNLQFGLRNAQTCKVTADGKVISGTTENNITHYTLTTHAATIIAQCSG